MATGKVGMQVWYQPTPEEYPTNPAQQAAIITGWDEETEKADLVIFPAGASYVIAKRGVVEGTVDGSFQQPSIQSDTAKATAQAKQEQQKAQAAAAKAQTASGLGQHRSAVAKG